MDMSPKAMRDRFKGRYSVEASRNRNWDEGQPKGFQGCDLAEAKGEARSIKSAATLTQGSVMKPGRTGIEGGKSCQLGFPTTGSPGMNAPATGPKSQKKPGYGGTPVQMGKTGGTDKSPPAMKESRFRGKSHGKIG